MENTNQIFNGFVNSIPTPGVLGETTLPSVLKVENFVEENNIFTSFRNVFVATLKDRVSSTGKIIRSIFYIVMFFLVIAAIVVYYLASKISKYLIISLFSGSVLLVFYLIYRLIDKFFTKEEDKTPTLVSSCNPFDPTLFPNLPPVLASSNSPATPQNPHSYRYNLNGGLTPGSQGTFWESMARVAGSPSTFRLPRRMPSSSDQAEKDANRSPLKERED